METLYRLYDTQNGRLLLPEKIEPNAFTVTLYPSEGLVMLGKFHAFVHQQL
jgi:hypothetical protein